MEMLLEKEEDNSYDVSAMVIKISDLIQIDKQYLDITVRPCKGKEPEQKVKDNAVRLFTAMTVLLKKSEIFFMNH